MSSKRFYTLPFVWNKTVWVITFATFALWIGLTGWLIYGICTNSADGELWAALFIFNIIMLPVVLACEGYAPQRLEIGADRIVVLRRYGSVTICRNEVKSVEALPEGTLRRAVRMGGVGGLFGYFGKYYSRKIGSFSLYATSFENLYLIRKWDGKNIVISCSEPDKMEHFTNI